MTDSMLGITPRCFICQAQEGLTLIEPPTWVCANHSEGTGVHLHFEAGEYITKPGTPVTTKIDQPRDHLGRFTTRGHYSDYATDD